MWLIVWLVAGCEAGVDPVVGEERPFTLWGIINSGADTQWVRVFPINDSTGFKDDVDLDAAVASTDLTTGDRRMWRYRKTIEDDGDVRHVFWSPFRAAHGHQYRLEVERADGAVSSATVSVPQAVEVELDVKTTAASMPVFIRGDSLNLIGVGMRYEATNLPPIKSLPEGRPPAPIVFFPVEVSYEGRGQRIPGGWRYSIDMERDVAEVRDAYEVNCLVTEKFPDIALRRVEFHFIAASMAWDPPGGAFDPEVLISPNAFSNVENGYGFMGAGEVVRVRWTPVPSLRRFLGFRYEQAEYGFDIPVPCIGEDRDRLWDIYFGGL